jgi:hypothetical protein
MKITITFFTGIGKKSEVLGWQSASSGRTPAL